MTLRQRSKNCNDEDGRPDSILVRIKTAIQSMPKTPFMLMTGVLLIISLHYLFKTVLLQVEPLASWSEKTVLVIRSKDRMFHGLTTAVSFIPPRSARDKNSFWDGVLQTLSNIEPAVLSQLLSIKSKTGYSPLELAERYLPEPFELLVLQKDTSNNESTAKYDFVLIAKSNGAGIENIPAGEKAAKDFASWYIPVKKYAMLNDGSRVISQTADPDKISLRTEKFNGFEVKFLSEPDLPFEYAYAQNEGWLYFSTSRSALEDTLERKNQKIPFEELSRNCASPKSGVHVFYNPRLFKIYSSNDPLVSGSPIKNALNLLLPSKVLLQTNNISLYMDECL